MAIRFGKNFPFKYLFPENTEKLLHLFSISFQLLNLSEVNGAVQNRRAKQEKNGMESVSGMWGNVFSDLKTKGIKEENIAQISIPVWQQPIKKL